MKRLLLNFSFFCLSLAQLRTGPLSVWYGDANIATLTSPNGNWPGFSRPNMFDENANTCWHSAREFERSAKTMKVAFKVKFHIKIFNTSKKIKLCESLCDIDFLT